MSRQYSAQQQVGPGGPPNNDWSGRGDRRKFGSGFQSQLDLTKSVNPSRPGTVPEPAYGLSRPASNLGFSPSGMNLPGQVSSQTLLGRNTDPRQSSVYNPSGTNLPGQASTQAMLLVVQTRDPRQPSILPNAPSGMNLSGQAFGPSADPRQPSIAAYSPSRNLPVATNSVNPSVTNLLDQNPQSRQASVLPNVNPPAELPNPRFRTAGSMNPYGQPEASFSGISGQTSPGPMQGQMSPGPLGGQMSPGPMQGQMSPGPMVGQMSPGPMQGQMSPGPMGSQMPGGQGMAGFGPTPADSSNPLPLQQFGNPNNGMPQTQSQTMNQMNNGMGTDQMSPGYIQDGIMDQGQMGRRSLDEGQGPRKTSGPQGNLDPNFPDPIALERSIHDQIEQIIRSRGHSMEVNRDSVAPAGQALNELIPVDAGAIQGICRMDINGISSDNAQLEKMLNTAIAKAFEKGYQCKLNEEKCCSRKKSRRRRCPQPNICFVQAPPACPPPQQKESSCPTGGSPGNCCDCQGMMMCGKSFKYPPSLTNFEGIRPLKIPGYSLFDKPPCCLNPVPAPPPNPCCKQTSTCPPPSPCCKQKPTCPPPPPRQQACGKPSNCLTYKPLPTCLMLPLRPSAPCPPPRRPRKQSACKSSKFVQSLLEISAALCDQQCALVKLMNDFR